MAAPLLSDYLSLESKQRFEDVQQGLIGLQIPFILNPYLVRGLDYYCQTAFEIMTHHIHTDQEQQQQQQQTAAHQQQSPAVSSSFASQSTVLAGGRYDGLCEQLGGPSLPAIGWAAGIDRLVLLIQAVQKNTTDTTIPTIAVISAGNAGSGSVVSPLNLYLRRLCSRLRSAGFSVCHALEKHKTSKQLSWAAKQNITVSLIVGEEELKQGIIQVKDMRSKQQQPVKEAELIAHMKALLVSSSNIDHTVMYVL